MTKAAQIGLYGSCWAIDGLFAQSATSYLSGISIADSVVMQRAFEDRAIETQNIAKRKRMDSGEPDPKPYEMIGSTAIIRVSGVMTKKPTSAQWLFGGTSTIETRKLLRAAQVDGDVKNILMVWDTPGGSCEGLSEFADQIRETNSVKQIVSFVDETCASAGVYGAVNTSAIYVPKMGMFGCIGTVAVVQDLSAAAAMEGVEVLVFKSNNGAYKGMGTPGTKFTDAQKSHMQSIVDNYGSDFEDQVAFGRQMSADQVKSIATGKMFTAEESLSLGLIDGIASFDDVVAMLSNSRQQGTPSPSTAKTPKRPAKPEDQMTLKNNIVAFLRGQKGDVLENAGINLEDIQASSEAFDDPRIEQALQAAKAAETRALAMQQASLNTSANAAFDAYLTPNAQGEALAVHAQREHFVALYKMCASVDGDGGCPIFDANGSLVEGSATASFRALFESSAPHRLFATEIAGAKPVGGSVNEEAVKGMLRHPSISPDVAARIKKSMGVS